MTTAAGIEAFIRTHVRAEVTRPAASPPDPAQCLRVERVAPVSLAAQIGIAPGDLLVTIDGAPAGGREPRLYRSHVAARRYVFHSTARNEDRDLDVTGIDLGVELARTPAALRARGAATSLELEALWKAKEWALLEALARPVVDRQRDNPALPLLGAALCETGRTAEGEALTREYADHYVSHWTMCFAAVAHYYNGLAALRAGDQRVGLSLLAEAWRNEPYPVIADAMEKHSGTRPTKPRPRWQGQRFPIDYRLPVIGAPQGVSLGGTLSLMAPHRVLVVCLLASYRGNGPYDDLLRRYRNFASFFRPFVQGIHVITEKPERPPDRAHYFETEDAVRAARLPFTLLHDTQGAVTRAVDPRGSPHVLVLDRERRVLYEGELECLDFWDVVGRLPDPPPAALAGAPEPQPQAPPAPAWPQWPVASGSGSAINYGGGLGLSFRTKALLAVTALVVLTSSVRGCRRRGMQVEDPRRAAIMAPTLPDRSSRALKALVEAKDLAVPLSPQTFADMDRAVREKGYGKATIKDAKPSLTYEGRSAVAYTRPDLLPEGKSYTSMSPSQLVTLVLTDRNADTLLLDGELITRAEINTVSAMLPPDRPPSFEVRVNARKR